MILGTSHSMRSEIVVDINLRPIVESSEKKSPLCQRHKVDCVTMRRLRNVQIVVSKAITFRACVPVAIDTGV